MALLFCGYLPTTHEGLLGRINTASPFGGMAALAWIGANDYTISASMTQAQAAKWRYCDGDWEARIEDATVVPDPARAGKEINVIINGEIGEPPLRWLRDLWRGLTFLRN